MALLVYASTIRYTIYMARVRVCMTAELTGFCSTCYYYLLYVEVATFV